MRIIVSGTRHYTNRARLYEVLDHVLKKHPDLAIVAGGARGADTLATDWARDRDRPLTILMADWAKHGKVAGALRNQAMLDVPGEKVAGVVAFPIRGGVGTQSMIRLARAAGVPVMIIDYPS